MGNMKFTASKAEIEDVLLRYPGKSQRTAEIIYRIEKRVGKEVYDFSETEFINTHTNIKIYCKIHKKSFNISYCRMEEVLSSETRTFCPNCSKEKKTIERLYQFSKDIELLPPRDQVYNTLLKEYPDKSLLTRIFIFRVIKLWGENKYDFSLTNYISDKIPIQIRCIEHNIIFTQTPANILNHQSGCPECLREVRSNSRRESRSEWVSIEKFEDIHDPILLKKTIKFIELSKKKFGPDRFGYDRCVCKNRKEKVVLYCNIDRCYFEVTTENHLRSQNGGCNLCYERCKREKFPSKGESFISKILTKNNISFVQNKKFPSSDFIGCPNKNYVEIDFVLTLNDKEYWIEYNGDQHYTPSNKFGGEERFLNYQLPRDKSISDYCLQNNITLIIIPYKRKIEEIMIMLSNELNINLN